MPQIKKKGKAGAAKNYVTRNQAIRKLQISLPDFRRLCIWKGIYPREPRDRKKVYKSSTKSTTFYYVRDIQYLQHEPLLQKFRDQKVLEKKITRALGRNDVRNAKRLHDNASNPEDTGRPRYTLNHVVRERYPTFTDALRDLDDCLSMLFLFSMLPATDTVPAKMIARCERLCLEFQHYVILSGSLRKSFISIKGIYYQATIQGEDVFWVVPHKFQQRVVGDVDFRIMGSFVEFYMTMLGFINFRLYTSLGLKYPPKFDASSDDKAAELGAFILEGLTVVEQKQITSGEETHEQAPDPKVQEQVNKVIAELKGVDAEETSTALVHVDQEESDANAIDKFEPTAPGGDLVTQLALSSNDTSTLFSNCVFFLSRETPRQPLEFILRAFGCRRIGWDSVLGAGAYTTNERDPRITHQIVDRPPIVAAANGDDEGDDNQTLQKLDANQRMPGRTYVQPQWVWDSVNEGGLKHPAAYAPGALLPPHFSPFVKKVQGAYDPSLPLEAQETEAEALEDTEDDDEVEAGEGMDVADDDDEDEDEDEDKEEAAPEVDNGGESDDGDDDDAQRQLELEAELAGAPIKTLTTTVQAKARREQRKQLAKKAQEEADDIERAKGMLSKRKRKLFEKMQYSNNKKSEEARVLRSKRRKIEAGGKP